MLVGYARVSTQEQNLDLQIKALEDAGCKKIFTEKASGALRERPELTEALKYLRPNAGDTLVVWKLDRLARSLIQLIDTIEKLEKEDIAFKSLTEAIDTSTSGGKLIFHIFGALAEFERGLIKERTIAALRAAKDAGKISGRPKSLKPEDLAVVRALLKDPKVKIPDIAKRLNIHVSTLYRHFPAARSTATV